MSRSFRPGRAATPPPRPLAGVPEFAPRKLPRQARSQATFTAIVDACSRVLANSSYEALTTNRISERAGVSIGTLYEYFPNREAIVAALVDAACRRLVARMERAVEEASRLPRFEGVEHLLTSGVETLAAPENGLTLLLRDAPFVSQLPAFREMREALTGLCQSIRVRSAARLDLASPVVDTWLISQMLFSAMLEIAFLDGAEAQRSLLRRELAWLTFRMAMGRDPFPSEMGRCAGAEAAAASERGGSGPWNPGPAGAEQFIDRSGRNPSG
jgi:AcrR family transcriptional regulator